MTSIDIADPHDLHSGPAHSSALINLGRQSVYLLTGFPITLVAFVFVITGLSLGVGLVITILGFPVLLATVFMARAFAHVERNRLVGLMDRGLSPVRYRKAGDTESWFQQVSMPLRDGQSWLDVAHAIVIFPVSIVTWTVAVTWWSGAVGGLGFVLWGWALPSSSDPGNTDLPELLGLGSSDITRAIFYTVAGLLFAVTLPWVIMVASKVHASVSKTLLWGKVSV